MPESQRGADIRRELARREAAAEAREATKTPPAPTGTGDTKQSRRKRPTKKEH
jgi:hypothetical protein